MLTVGVPEMLFILVFALALFGGRIFSVVWDATTDSLRNSSMEIWRILRWLNLGVFFVLGLRLLDMSDSKSHHVGHQIGPAFGISLLVTAAIAAVDAVLQEFGTTARHCTAIRWLLFCLAFSVLVVGFILGYSH